MGAIMIDLTKAFDSVDHSQLIFELNKIGCSTQALRWFSSFLNNRYQRVKSGNLTAAWKPVTKGVPQGSPLSPLLFNILVRNLPSESGSDCFQFADDLTNSVSSNNLEELGAKLKCTYENVKGFCHSFNLHINLKKTQLIVFKPVQRPLTDEFHIQLDEATIYPEKEVKLLGFMLDRHFTMGCHISSTVTKCHGLLGVLRRASSSLSRNSLRLVYSSLIRTHLEYCSAVFAHSAPSHLHKLDIIQKIASRIIMNTDRQAHAAPLLEALGLAPLSDRRTKHIECIVTNIVTGRAHPFFQNFFKQSTDDMTISNTESRLRAKSFSSFGKQIYNTLGYNRVNTNCDSDLQSLSTGRPSSQHSTGHSAVTQQTSTNGLPVSTTLPLSPPPVSRTKQSPQSPCGIMEDKDPSK